LKERDAFGVPFLFYRDERHAAKLVICWCFMPSEDICVKLKFNPEDLPVQSLATEAADEHLLSTITSFKPASVLIPLVMRDQGLTLLLTHRAAHLNDHAGQISFPGGRCEDSDGSVVETALREAEEEVGLHRKHIDVIGILPEYRTGTGYQVTPVVALIQPPFELKIDASEVASLFEVPLSFLMDGQNYQRRAFDLPNGQGQRVFYAIPYQQHFIWGATAGMLRNLFHLLRA